MNEMHGQYRDLNTKYVRQSLDLQDAINAKTELEELLKTKTDENTLLNQKMVDQNSRTNSQIEKITSLQRELGIKSQQIQEFEIRFNKI